jgi:subtilase family serine protease
LTTSQSAGTTTLTYTVTAEDGTDTFTNVTIPKSAVSYGTIPLIYIGNQKVQNQGYTQDADNYYVWSATHFNGSFYGELTIEFTNGSSSSIISPIIIGIIIAIAVAVLALLAYRRRKRE